LDTIKYKTIEDNCIHNNSFDNKKLQKQEIEGDFLVQEMLIF
jgi:hypothetical protein